MNGGTGMPKNIVVFSDGTGQDGGVRAEQRMSNIFKMYRATAHYHKGNKGGFRNGSYYKKLECERSKRILFEINLARFTRFCGLLSWFRLSPSYDKG